MCDTDHKGHHQFYKSLPGFKYFILPTVQDLLQYDFVFVSVLSDIVIFSNEMLYDNASFFLFVWDRK